MGEDGRVFVTDSNQETFDICPSYGLLVHIHNDTLATLLCQKLEKGNVGIAMHLPTEPDRKMKKGINVNKGNLEVVYGDVVTDNCKGFDRSLAITCAGTHLPFDHLVRFSS